MSATGVFTGDGFLFARSQDVPGNEYATVIVHVDRDGRVTARHRLDGVRPRFAWSGTTGGVVIMRQTLEWIPLDAHGNAGIGVPLGVADADHHVAVVGEDIVVLLASKLVRFKQDGTRIGMLDVFRAPYGDTQLAARAGTKGVPEPIIGWHAPGKVGITH
jgi:hypothetical protein